MRNITLKPYRLKRICILLLSSIQLFILNSTSAQNTPAFKLVRLETISLKSQSEGLIKNAFLYKFSKNFVAFDYIPGTLAFYDFQGNLKFSLASPKLLNSKIVIPPHIRIFDKLFYISGICEVEDGYLITDPYDNLIIKIDYEGNFVKKIKFPAVEKQGYWFQSQNFTPYSYAGKGIVYIPVQKKYNPHQQNTGNTICKIDLNMNTLKFMGQWDSVYMQLNDHVFNCFNSGVYDSENAHFLYSNFLSHKIHVLDQKDAEVKTFGSQTYFGSLTDHLYRYRPEYFDNCTHDLSVSDSISYGFDNSRQVHVSGDYIYRLVLQHGSYSDSVFNMRNRNNYLEIYDRKDFTHLNTIPLPREYRLMMTGCEEAEGNILYFYDYYDVSTGECRIYKCRLV